MTVLLLAVGIFGASFAFGMFAGHLIARGQGECHCPKCKEQDASHEL